MSAAWNLKPAPKPRVPGVGLEAKDRELYGMLHIAWAAGVLPGEWGLFAPEPDAEPEWWVQDARYAHEDRDSVRAHLGSLMFFAGVKSLAWGGQWCGRRDVIVSYVDSGEVAA